MLSLTRAPALIAPAGHSGPSASSPSHQDASNAARATAKLGSGQAALVEATDDAPSQRASESVPQDLANAVWALAVSAIKQEPAPQAAAAGGAPVAAGLNPQNLANAAWPFEDASPPRTPLARAAPDAALGCLAEFEVQPLATLCDRTLPHQSRFHERLRPVAKAFFLRIPNSLAREEWDDYARAVDEAGIDNFGSVGTRLLLGWLGVPEAPARFCRRGLEEGWVPRLGRLLATVEREGVQWTRTRVVGHVQYDLAGGLIRGEEAAENAYHGEVRGDSRWLRATTPPFNLFADRRTCCEFRFFDRIIEQLDCARMASDPVRRAQVTGYVTMHINAPPCVSCIGVVRQVQLLFPNIQIQLCGGRVPDQDWSSTWWGWDSWDSWQSWQWW